MTPPTTTQSTPLHDQDCSLPEGGSNDDFGDGDWDSNDDGVNEEWDLQSPLLMTPSRCSTGQNSLLQSGHDQDIFPPVEDENILENETLHSNGQSSIDLVLFVAAGSMIILFVGCVSCSFNFAWWDTVVKVHSITVVTNGDQVAIGKPIDVEVPILKDQTFQSLLSIFSKSESFTIEIQAVLFTLVAPFLYMILQIFVLSLCRNSSRRFNPNTGKGSCNDYGSGVLSLLEILMKFSFSIIYVIAIMNVCMSTVHFALGGDHGMNVNLQHDSNDNNGYIYANVINKARGGFISYLLGFSFGITSLVALRILFTRTQKSYDVETNIDNLPTPSDTTDSNDRGLSSNTILSPPPHAFHIAQNEEIKGEGGVGNGDHDDTVQSDITPVMTNGQTYDRRPDTTNGAEDCMIQRIDLAGDENPNNTGGNNCGRRSILTILAFESGLLSLLSIIPCIRLPLIRLHYSGLLTPLLDDRVNVLANLDLWSIIHSVSTQSGNGVFAFVSVGLFWTNVIIIPALTLLASMIVWFLLLFSNKEESVFATRSFSVLKLLHPSSCLTPFTISLILTISSIEQVTDFLFNRYGLCETFGVFIGLDQDEAKCLTIAGDLESGFWFLFLHVFCFDFCVTMLRMLLEPLPPNKRTPDQVDISS